MYYTATINLQKNRLITLSSSHQRTNLSKEHKEVHCKVCEIFELDYCHCKKQYTQTKIGTKAYKDALQHSFNVASRRVFNNPDMKYFLTFTYRDNITDVDKVLKDIKTFIKTEKRYLEQSAPEEKKQQTKKTKQNRNTNTSDRRQAMNGNPTANSLNGLHHDKRRTKRATDSKHVSPKYIFILEVQSRGAIHVHMISNGFFRSNKNKNGYNELTMWKHGYTSILQVKDFDRNFKPFLYMFKYMRKSQRVGRSFVHSSRNLDNYRYIDYDDVNLNDWRLIHSEIREYKYIDDNGKELVNYYYKHFYQRLE